ncbi:MAG: M81 family metallopeptidase [Rubrivivax sp.]
MRVFTAALATETNTFSPLPTGLASYQERDYFPAGTHPDHPTGSAGPLWALREVSASRRWTVIEGLVASAQPGGITTRQAWDTLSGQLLDDLRAALPVDMVLLGLHGAMVAEGCDDCEGDLLGRVRAIVGPGVVVGAEIDPHNHLSDAMVRHADVLVSMKEYPHTDIVARGRELVALCEATALKRIRPVAAVADCRMIVPFHTTRQPARGLVDRIQAMEGQGGVLSISLTHGFSLGDVPDMGTRVLVYCDGDADQAQALARRLADEIIGLRDQLAVRYLGVDEALDAALALLDNGAGAAGPGGPVVLADRADNPGSGAPGDSTFILRRLVERGIGGVAVGPLWDPVAVRICHEAGEGATLPLRVGGKIGPTSGDPLDLTVTVKALRREHRMTALSGSLQSVGDAAWVEADGVDIVLVTVRRQATGTDLFTGLGCDLAARRLIVVKSAQHFHAAFSKVAKHVLYVGAPGAATPFLHTLPYRKIRRPMWPLDAGA